MMTSYDQAVDATVSRLTDLIQSASESLDAILSPSNEFSIPLPRLLLTGKPSLRRRCVFTAVPRQDIAVAEWPAVVSEFVASGWSVRVAVNRKPTRVSLLVDDKEGFAGDWYPIEVWAFETGLDLQAQRRQFDEVWRGGIVPDSLYDDRSSHGLFKRVLVDSAEFWDHLIALLAVQPADLQTLSPRRFEELVAELLIREGLAVTLTPETRDGGRDILAFMTTPLGTHLHLVECKRFAATRSVGVSLVRALYGVVSKERATSGLLVTTSRFTRDAVTFSESLRYQLSLVDNQALVEWLRRHHRT